MTGLWEAILIPENAMFFLLLDRKREGIIKLLTQKL
jgi:hypothetical protein